MPRYEIDPARFLWRCYSGTWQGRLSMYAHYAKHPESYEYYGTRTEWGLWWEGKLAGRNYYCWLDPSRHSISDNWEFPNYYQNPLGHNPIQHKNSGWIALFPTTVLTDYDYYPYYAKDWYGNYTDQWFSGVFKNFPVLPPDFYA